jgi:hypothetical protein
VSRLHRPRALTGARGPFVRDLDADLIIGPKPLPEAGRALGQGIKEFKGSISPGHDDSPDETSAPRSTPETGRGEIPGLPRFAL